MKSFEDNKVLRQPLSPALLSTARVIGEFKGKQDLWQRQFPEVLNSLKELAIIQSTESSNRLEQITAAPERLRDLVFQRTMPADRSEQEIAGYRDVLATIHTSHPHIPLRPNIIAQLHRDLMKFTPEPGGRWKHVENEIADFHVDGTRTTRFRCVSVTLTPEWMERLCDGFNRLRDQEAAEPLLLIPAFVLDFLCVHPFLDGNGRVARLLTLLLLYQSGYEVGRYISLERIIEESKESYYESLRASSQGWHEGQHDLSPWRDYFLGTIVAAYRELERRAELATATPGAKRNLIREAVEHFVADFTSKELELACPMVSREMIRVVLREMQAEGKVEKIGEGRGARWKRIR
ncbi:MAG: Fic family protein [Planctomycetes bacterium]|nr:Fic family protein [Planctomycetota bacterium]